MILTFQIVLLIIMLSSAAKATESKDMKGQREAALIVFIGSIAAFIVSVMWL